MSKLWHHLNFPIPGIDPNSPVLANINKIDFSKNNYRQYLVENKYLITPELNELFNNCGLPLMDHTLLLACNIGALGFLHKDVHVYQEWNGKYCHGSINFHLTPHYGSLDWFNKDNGPIEITEVNTPYEVFNADGTQVDTWPGPGPALVRTDVAHRANNLLGTGVRFTATLRFDQNPDWDVIVKKLKDYIL
jgi:hypothetical protein